MKSLIVTAAAIFALAVLPTSSWADCLAGDQEISRIEGFKQQRCTTAGYCYMYDLNPQNGLWEHFYGYHRECPGFQEQKISEIFCEKSDGSSYSIHKEEPWDLCRI